MEVKTIDPNQKIEIIKVHEMGLFMDNKTVMPLLDTTYFGKFNDGGYVNINISISKSIFDKKTNKKIRIEYLQVHEKNYLRRKMFRAI